jgi:hypothetical protein
MIQRKKVRRRKPKDILVLTLQNLSVKEGFICTRRTYDNIKDRIDAFSASHKERQYQTRPWGVLMNTRRVA